MEAKIHHYMVKYQYAPNCILKVVSGKGCFVLSQCQKAICFSGLSVGTMSRSTDGVHQQVTDEIPLVSVLPISLLLTGVHREYAEQ